MDGERAGVKGWHEGTKWHEGTFGGDGYGVYLHCGNNIWVYTHIYIHQNLSICEL